MTPRRILFATNPTSPRSGIAEFGRIFVEALARAGHTVAVWDLDHLVPAGPFDLCLVNWHPWTLRGDVTRAPDDLPTWVYLNDTPPHSQCPWTGVTGFWAPDHILGMDFYPYPVIDWPLTRSAPRLDHVTIGSTSVRGDGVDAIEAYCRARGYTFNGSDPARWLSTEEEIERLSHSTLNVCWYYASGRGQASAVSACLASGRPLLVNASDMFRITRELVPGVLYAPEHGAEHLPAALDRVLAHRMQTPLPTPDARVIGWAPTIRRMEQEWDRCLV